MRTRKDNPFDPDSRTAYLQWRDQKLENYPRSIDDLIVEIKDARRLATAEREAILIRCEKANMAIYACRTGAWPDKEVPRALARQFGLTRLDRNPFADEDGITSIMDTDSADRRPYIPYTNRPIKWHTDGYYNDADRNVQALILHCICAAPVGGDNALLDHEIAYLLLRDRDPDFIRALMQPDAMTIPPGIGECKMARSAQTGPVFSISSATGTLHMRYTERTRNIGWKQHPDVLASVAYLNQILSRESPFIFRGKLEPGMGLICNNVLHDRSGFADDPSCRRLLYRARYYDRIGEP